MDNSTKEMLYKSDRFKCVKLSCKLDQWLQLMQNKHAYVSLFRIAADKTKKLRKVNFAVIFEVDLALWVSSPL